MKVALYVEDGTTQVVLTPEDEFEFDVVKKMGDNIQSVQLFVGSFYDCRGGWIRQSAYQHHTPYSDPDDKSIIIRLDNQED